MGHLYHGYVSHNQMVVVPCPSDRRWQLLAWDQTSSLQVANQQFSTANPMVRPEVRNSVEILIFIHSSTCAAPIFLCFLDHKTLSKT